METGSGSRIQIWWPSVFETESSFISATFQSRGHFKIITSVFAALQALHATRSSREKAVCPAFRLSVERVDCEKTEETCADVLIPHERSFIPVL